MSAVADIGMRARIVRFGVSGAACTALHAAIAGVLMGAFAATAVQANAIAFVCATGASYLLNTPGAFPRRCAGATSRASSPCPSSG